MGGIAYGGARTTVDLTPTTKSIDEDNDEASNEYSETGMDVDTKSTWAQKLSGRRRRTRLP